MRCELIIFPDLYEQVHDQLQQDVVVKVTGKIVRDRDGILAMKAKMIADEIDIISDKELSSYRSTGRKMAAPTTCCASSQKSAPTKTVATAATSSRTSTPVGEISSRLHFRHCMYV